MKEGLGQQKKTGLKEATMAQKKTPVSGGPWCRGRQEGQLAMEGRQTA